GMAPLAAAQAAAGTALPAIADPARTGLAVLAGGLGLSLALLAAMHHAMRRRWRGRLADLERELRRARLAADQAEVFLASEPQALVSWPEPDGAPRVEAGGGFLPQNVAQERLLAFGAWLRPADARALERAVEGLRAAGAPLSLTLQALDGRYIAAEGRIVAGAPTLRLRDVSGEREGRARLEDQLAATGGELEAVRDMLDEIPQPVWVRDRNDRIVWTNAAYVRAVEAPDMETVVRQGLELLDQAALAESRRQRAMGAPWQARLPAVIAGDRRIMEVVETPGASGSAGIATDVSELARLRDDFTRQMEAHARTLDQLPTAVAIFDGSRRLIFHNPAYRLLWKLDQDWLDTAPTDDDILERLRNWRRLPEEADFRQWKANVLSGYTAVEPQSHAWHLPDGRTIRVVVNPNPQGGVTYLYDDVTERYLLETRYNSMLRVQGETLDTLREGVAVFGQDGRLRLSNPAFASLWGVPAEVVAAGPHVDEVMARASRIPPDDGSWAMLRGAIVGMHDDRRGGACRMENLPASGDGGRVIDCNMAPLPDGSMLLTFTDVTDSVRIERALTERNEALLKASQLRDDFVHHVSYELRSPLTNIIGFVEMLASGMGGPLNERQREYADHIMQSSTALNAIIDDILDLASIDNGELELVREPIDLSATIAAATRGVEDRLAEAAITLHVEAPPDIRPFEADVKRLRQVLFNLLSNAIRFSDRGSNVWLKVSEDGDYVRFDVIDEGRGIPASLIDRVFDRFESHGAGQHRRGVGLGLSMVRAFVELHGGRVEIASREGVGTRVSCFFPATPAPAA
ncbi:PAS-domain containing protein, partial [Camelimonas abortus]